MKQTECEMRKKRYRTDDRVKLVAMKVWRKNMIKMNWSLGARYHNGNGKRMKRISSRREVKLAKGNFKSNKKSLATLLPHLIIYVPLSADHRGIEGAFPPIPISFALSPLD